MISYTGRNRQTVNYLKAVYFDYPDWTPCTMWLMPATWIKYRQQLEELVLQHPRSFPGFKRGSYDYDAILNPLYEEGEHLDCWGTVWENIQRGMDSADKHHPLADWAAFDTWKAPDPMKDDMFGPRDWPAVQRQMQESRQRGDLAIGGGLPHGFMYMRLYYMRGFENLMMDLAMDEPRLHKLIQIVQDYNVAVIGKYLSMGAEYMSLGEDLGNQKSLPISPAMWRRYIKPSYEAMFGPCRDREVVVHLHSDGNILTIIPDLIETGVRVLNPQFRANGLAGLREVARGKVCLLQDLDRQLLPFGTPQQAKDHVHQVYEGLNLPQGGLMFYAEFGPDVPLANIDATLSALEDVCHLPEPTEG